MDERKIVLEKAKDDLYTCKIEIDNKWRYMYSKYKPLNSIKLYNIDCNKDYIVLGLGLGYEVQALLSLTKGQVYVIDEDKTFLDIISKIGELKSIINNKVTFLFGDDFKKIDKERLLNAEVINNKNITQFSTNYFSKVIRYVYQNKTCNDREKIVFFEHVTIADDCIEALRNLEYNVVKMQYSPEDKLIMDIAKENPKYVFTINLSKRVFNICKKLDIKYISWAVDVPLYSLYDSLIKDENLLTFICDESIVKKLKSKGVNNVHYMPVAANVNRLDKIRISNEDIKNYSSEISFLGTSGKNNEYNNYWQKYLSKSLEQKINDIFYKQWCNRSDFLIEKCIDNELIKNIEEETGYKILGEDLLDRKEKLAYLLGRKFNEIERGKLAKEISRNFSLDIYGDETWSSIDGIKYRGYAEHFYEMPKIFKLSKININLTRIYVETGLPMRVFDILGSGGFLVTNYKKDILRYFKDGKELVIYRDFQDLKEIIEYYLQHDKERREIIKNGYLKVKNNHNYEIRLKEIMNIAKTKNLR